MLRKRAVKVGRLRAKPSPRGGLRGAGEWIGVPWGFPARTRVYLRTSATQIGDASRCPSMREIRASRHRAFLCERQVVGSGELQRRRSEGGSEGALPPGNVETHFRSWLNNSLAAFLALFPVEPTRFRERDQSWIRDTRANKCLSPGRGDRPIVDAVKLVHKKFITLIILMLRLRFKI